MAQKYSQIKKTQLLILLTHGLQEDFTFLWETITKSYRYIYTTILLYFVTTLRVQFKLPEKLEDFSRHAFLETDVLEVCTTSKVKRLKFDATDGNDGATTARYTFSVKSQHS